jgi:hypothetical protein
MWGVSVVALLAFGYNIAPSVATCDDDTLNALKALYRDTNGPDWTKKTGWMDESLDPCHSSNKWFGVIPDNAKVVGIQLGENSLSGTIPAEFGMLTDTTMVEFYNDNITGTLPPEIGQMTEMKWFRVPGNSFTGTIPSELGLLSQVTYLRLARNTFTGEIPSQLGQMTLFDGDHNYNFRLNTNQLCGEVPEEVAAMDGGDNFDVYEGNLFLGVPCGEYLANWMGQVAAAFQFSSIFDMSLPGTHDTLTYDLSTVISDGGIDGHDELSIFLNTVSNLDDNLDALEFARVMAQSQSLDVTAQLDAGIRFLDLRFMFSDNQWVGLHCVETNQPALVYMSQIHDWMVAHPTELVVMWISKHGSQCAVGDDAYPGVDIETKQAFWAQIEDMFSDIIFDTTKATINETTYPELIENNFTAIFFVSDYVEFSNSSQYAIDGCLLDNGGSSSIGTNIFADSQQLYESTEHRATDNAEGKYWLLSMANSPPGDGIGLAAKIALDPKFHSGEKYIAECAGEYPIDNFTDWCPASLLDVGQLTAYYKQQSLLNAWNNQSDLPHAIYIDAVTSDGLIRTGTRRLNDDSDGPICDTFVWSECEDRDSDFTAALKLKKRVKRDIDDTTTTDDDDEDGDDDSSSDSSSSSSSSSSDGDDDSSDSDDDIVCPDDHTANGDHSLYKVYDSDGTSQSGCMSLRPLDHEVHYRCCRDADADHAEEGFGYVHLMIATNVRRGCAAMSSKMSSSSSGSGDGDNYNPCADLVSETSQMFLDRSGSVWSDIETGRLLLNP